MTRLRGVPQGEDLKFAVIANIRSNLAAFKAVIADTRRQGLTSLIDLGDSISGPLDPAKTADLMLRMRYVTVLGRCDRRLLEGDTTTMSPVEAYAAEQISAAHRKWLRSLPKVWTLGARILACHGLPDDDTVSLTDVPGPDGRMILAPRAWIEQQAKDLRYDLILTGQGHEPRVVRLADGRLIVNPGSVGCPGYGETRPAEALVGLGHNCASYAILEADDDGWDVSFRLVKYDSAGAARKASLHRFPDWADAFALRS